jgi:hypothetical protein
MRFLIILLMLGTLAGCQLSLTDTTVISYTESDLAEKLDISRAPLMCDTVDKAMDLAVTGVIAEGCERYSIFVPRVRSYFWLDRRMFTLLEQGPPYNLRFWLEPGRYRP